MMTGNLVNTAAILLGGLVGLLFRKGLSERFKDIIMQAIGLAVLFIGLTTALSGLMNPESDPLLFILALAGGGILGEALKMEQRLEQLGNRIQHRMGEGHGTLSEGFVTSSLLFCVGSMAVIGSFKSGLEGDHSVLFAKAILDGVASIILASSLGIGVLFSALSVFLYQGSITLLSGFLEPWISQAMIREISNVGGILITAIGINLLKIRQIKTGNLLPSLFIPPLYLLVRSVFQ